jgi:hypothetical protein
MQMKILLETTADTKEYLYNELGLMIQGEAQMTDRNRYYMTRT